MTAAVNGPCNLALQTPVEPGVDVEGTGMGALEWLIVVLVLLAIVAAAFLIVRRRRRGGGVYATRAKP